MTGIINPNHHNLSSYFIYLIGNVTFWVAAKIQTDMDEFRAWITWSIGIAVGILTIIKLVKDIRAQNRRKDD